MLFCCYICTVCLHNSVYTHANTAGPSEFNAEKETLFVVAIYIWMETVNMRGSKTLQSLTVESQA